MNIQHNNKKPILLIATHNKAKLRQMSQYLKDLPYQIVSLNDLGIDFDVEETGTTFAQNALLKATTYAKLSGLLTLADDSGLEVEALGGEPGIYSARYAGPNKTDEQKIDYLLDKIKEVPEGKRQARFSSAVALAWPDGTTKLYEGQSTGAITFTPRGASYKGFPYYRIYILDGYDKTLAELEDEGIPYTSHRQKALDLVIADLKKS